MLRNLMRRIFGERTADNDDYDQIDYVDAVRLTIKGGRGTVSVVSGRREIPVISFPAGSAPETDSTVTF